MNATEEDLIKQGQDAYEQSRAQFFADPENRRIYEQEAAKKELWRQLVEARQAAGLTQAEVATRLGLSPIAGGQAGEARL